MRIVFLIDFTVLKKSKLLCLGMSLCRHSGDLRWELEVDLRLCVLNWATFDFIVPQEMPRRRGFHLGLSGMDSVDALDQQLQLQLLLRTPPC
mmetsp:Transcript_26734/g.54683  ORF Transcript_26734/g.54683 Transcript_26734/m.54683 type:complete len:92 (-) Transcript_26734:42-317(-)